MSGIGLVWDNTKGEADLATGEDGRLLAGDPLVTNAYILIFTRGRAPSNPGVLPNVPSGWWADGVSDQPIGGLLWTLRNAKITDETIRKASLYTRTSLLRWLRGGVAKTVDAAVSRNSIDVNRLDISVEATRPDGTLWAHVWEGVPQNGL